MIEQTAAFRPTIPHKAFQTLVQPTKATFQALHRVLVLIAVLLTSLGFAAQSVQAQASNPQQAILTASGSSNQIVVYPDARQTPTPAQKFVPGLPAGALPHGVAYYDSDNALVSDFRNSRIFAVNASTASLLATIDTSAAGYDGTGTIAAAPDHNTVLASGEDANVYVIRGPFNASSTITKVALPGSVPVFQTQAIVFNKAGRAFVSNSGGISVLDAPYTSVAFTIPITTGFGGAAIAITPDGNTLLTTAYTNTLGIFSAPFSAASQPRTLTFGLDLNGIMVTPDGTKALVVDFDHHNVYAVSAPFNASSKVETLPLPAGVEGFEDVGISADSQTAILAGRAAQEPPVFIRAPFTAAGATSYYVPVDANNTARGGGSVRFQPSELAPGLTISKSAAATVASGSNLTYTLTYANMGSANASSVIIRDSLPAGTTFVSATNGGTVSNGSVVFNIDALSSNSGSQTVSFTVRVTAAQGATVTNSGYTIEANGVAPISGSPVTTTVTAAPVQPPVANNDNATVAQNSSDNPIDVLANDTDPNGLPLVVTGVGPASNGTVTFDDGQVFYTPDEGFSGSDSFQYSISNSQGATATGTVSVTVNPLSRRVFGQGTINTQGNRKGTFSFDATTIGAGPQANGTFSFSRRGGPFIVFHAPVENLVVSNGTSATFSGVYIRNGRTGAPIATYVATITDISSPDTFSIQVYRANDLKPFYSASGPLTSGFVTIS